ncbi:MAG: hypothetical protein JNK49_19655 [Planctomycetes bacterium]|nr:hypothetical protein [Planctomycetota bacterium]
MSACELTDAVKAAVVRLFPEHTAEVEAALLHASGSKRVHAVLLAVSYGDFAGLVRLCEEAKLDSRDILIAEECPEQFLGIANRSGAAAELAQRFRALQFQVPPSTAYWARLSGSG